MIPASAMPADGSATTRKLPRRRRTRGKSAAAQALIQTLALYRKICRDELQAEQCCSEARNIDRKQLHASQPTADSESNPQRHPIPGKPVPHVGRRPAYDGRPAMTKKLCPNCEELLKPTSNPEVGQCSGCGWSGHYWRAASEPALPAVTRRRCPTSASTLRPRARSRNLPDSRIRSRVGRLDEAHRPVADLSTAVWSTRISRQRLRLGHERRLPLQAPLRPSGSRASCDPDQVADDFAAWLERLRLGRTNRLDPGRQKLRQLRPAIPETAAKIRAGGEAVPPHAGPSVVLLACATTRNCPTARPATSGPGWTRKVAHTALEDALAVVRLVRMGVKRLLATVGKPPEPVKQPDLPSIRLASAHGAGAR